MTDQPGLDGRYTVFARVVEGMLVAQQISETAVDDTGVAVERVAVTKVTIRDKPAEWPEPFSTETPDELAQYRVVLDTSFGEIALSFTPGPAPMHVRNFLRLAQAGVYDGMSFHRVVKGFVIQSGHLPTRGPLSETQQKYIRPLKAEFNDQLHDVGTLSMARTDDPDSATSSFFIVTARAQTLDGKYTAFGKVESGLDVVRKIEAVALNGETPVERVELRKVSVVRKPQAPDPKPLSRLESRRLGQRHAAVDEALHVRGAAKHVHAAEANSLRPQKGPGARGVRQRRVGVVGGGLQLLVETLEEQARGL